MLTCWLFQSLNHNLSASGVYVEHQFLTLAPSLELADVPGNAYPVATAFAVFFCRFS